VAPDAGPPAPLPRKPVRGLDHVVIGVSDWDASNAFYRDVVGAEVVAAGDGFQYRVGDQQLNVHGPGAHGSPVAGIPVRPGMGDVCFVWDGDIEEAITHLARHDVEVVEGPVTRRGARGEGTSVYFRDPDGSLLEFIAYP
jgi:catechol 2,3-dioxygenase-like lactoylglutathione lyase family enzyme